jgi:radical SAM superfamily enzyme YgiQ (UPF0313 family)
MKLALLNPNFNDSRASDALQPLVYAILKALTPGEVVTVFHDERVEAVDYGRVNADLAALSVQTFTAKRSYAIADGLRRRGVRVVLGGAHPTLLPEEAGEHADAVVIGDAEPVWRELLDDAARGRLRKIYTGDVNAPLGGLMPDRSIFRGKRYARLLPVQFGRGCRFDCDFCSVKAFYGASVRQRPVAEVVEEIRRLAGRFLFFVDDNILVNRDRTVELLEALVPLRKRWACQISVDAAFDETLLASMRQSGCVQVFMGFESMDPGSLKEMAKSANLRHRDHVETVRRLRRAGIMASGSFVFGYDRDAPETIRRALRFALEAKLVLAHFNAAMPTPATRLYARLAAEGRLCFDRWWLHPDYRYGASLFVPKRMSREELAEGIYAAKREFNSIRNILRRAREPSTNSRNAFNLGVYILGNLISRREIRRKQGFALG